MLCHGTHGVTATHGSKISWQGCYSDSKDHLSNIAERLTRAGCIAWIG